MSRMAKRKKKQVYYPVEVKRAAVELAGVRSPRRATSVKPVTIDEFSQVNPGCGPVTKLRK